MTKQPMVVAGCGERSISQVSHRRRFLPGLLALGALAAFAAWNSGLGPIGDGTGHGAQPGDAPTTTLSPAREAWLRATVGGVPPAFDFVASWSSPVMTKALARGDFNGDGRDDLAAVATEPPEYDAIARLYVFLQQPDGSLAPPVVSDLPRVVVGGGVAALAAGDLDEDGRDDLVFTHWMAQPGLMIALSTPSGGFDWHEDDWNDGFPAFESLYVSDQDGDGHRDVVGSLGTASADSLGGGQIATWFGDGHGGIARHLAIATGSRFPTVALGQLDGASRPDALEVAPDENDSVWVHRADGAGGWLPPVRLPDLGNDVYGYGRIPWGGTVFDANGDGREDAVVGLSAWTPGVLVYAQKPDGTIDPVPQRVAAGTATYVNQHADFDGNGLQDLVQLRPDFGDVRFHYQLQDAYGLDYPVAQSAPVPSPEFGQSEALVVGDFNHDGTPDVALALQRGGIELYRGRLTSFAGTGNVPGAPQVLSAVADPGAQAAAREVDVTLAAPASTGGNAITGYTVYPIPGGGIDADAGKPGLVHRIVGLEPETAYTFRARASNVAGKGPMSVAGAPASTPTLSRQLTLSVSSFYEGDYGDAAATVTVSVSPKAPAGGITLTLSTQGGTATPGVDYEPLPPTQVTIPAGEYNSVEIPIIIHGDLVQEDDESFQVVASNVQGAPAPSPAIASIINDDGPTPRLVGQGVDVTEGNAGVKHAFVPLHLTQAQGQDVQVTVAAFAGSAQLGSDYLAPPAVVTIPAGQTLVQVPVDVLGDTRLEADEFVVLMFKFSTDPPNLFGSTAYVRILNDDAVPVLSVADATVQEGNNGVTLLHFKASLSGPQLDDAVFSAKTVAGTALPDIDYVDTRRTGLRIPAGQTEADIVVPVLGDLRSEGNEQFTLQLVAPEQVTLGDAEAVGTIVDDDGTAGISVLGVSRPEGNGPGTAHFRVQLASAQAGPVTFSVRTADGTAFADSDYTAVALDGLVIPAGQTELGVDVPILGDTASEPDETFVLELTSVSGAVPVRGQGLARLLDDDLPSLSIADASVVEGDSYWPGNWMHFEVTLSAPSTRMVEYRVRVGRVGTADPFNDVGIYVATLPIDAGRTRQVLEVPIFGDTMQEANETFSVEVTSIFGATVGDGYAVGTIIDDDAPSAIAAGANAAGRGVLKRVAQGRRAARAAGARR